MLLYNTLSRREEEFEPSQDNTVRMYSCGLTVYGRGHIGNFRTFVCVDVLRRTLEHQCGYAMRQAMNFTDVDDRTIAGAQTSAPPTKVGVIHIQNAIIGTKTGDTRYRWETAGKDRADAIREQVRHHRAAGLEGRHGAGAPRVLLLAGGQVGPPEGIALLHEWDFDACVRYMHGLAWRAGELLTDRWGTRVETPREMVGAMIRNARIFCLVFVGTAAATPSMIAMLWIPVHPRMISTR